MPQCNYTAALIFILSPPVPLLAKAAPGTRLAGKIHWVTCVTDLADVGGGRRWPALRLACALLAAYGVLPYTSGHRHRGEMQASFGDDNVARSCRNGNQGGGPALLSRLQGLPCQARLCQPTRALHLLLSTPPPVL